jgi:hypothetical protein
MSRAANNNTMQKCDIDIKDDIDIEIRMTVPWQGKNPKDGTHDSGPTSSTASVDGSMTTISEISFNESMAAHDNGLSTQMSAKLKQEANPPPSHTSAADHDSASLWMDKTWLLDRRGVLDLVARLLGNASKTTTAPGRSTVKE